MLARALLSLAGAGLGFVAASYLDGAGLLTGPLNPVYLSVAGLLLGYLCSGALAERFARLWQALLRRVQGVPPDVVLAAGSGATVALLLTVLLNSVLQEVPGFTWYWSLLIAATLVTGACWFFVANRQLFTSWQRPPPNAAPRPGNESIATTAKLVDTSAIIDGRIVDVVAANFLEGPILVPNFVLGELQHIADADDPLRRKRGRRGLEMLDKLVQQPHIKAAVINRDVPEAKQVDEKLVRLCLRENLALITTDFNLNRVAALQGVRVLNVNQLANAVKAMYLPGERLSLHIVKEGRESGQGLAYLEDGTMIVIEEAAHLVGRTVETVVTSNLQTNMGRMIFTRLQEEVRG